MIIYGSRVYGRKNPVQGWGTCDACGTYGPNLSYEGRRWGHIYFIPLIPMGSRIRVMKQCKKCSQGLHIPEKDLPEMVKDVRQSSDGALAALIAGHKEFDDKGNTTSCTACLAGCVELLHCMGEGDHVRLVLAALQEKNLTAAYHLVNGESLEFQGKLRDAADAYRQAAECDPSDPRPLLSLASVHLNQAEPETARELLGNALELAEDKVPVYLMLLTAYEMLNDHANLAATYEECFRLIPELEQDKKVVKLYKKACKKAGKTPLK